MSAMPRLALVIEGALAHGPRQRAGLEGGAVALFLRALLDHPLVSTFAFGLQARDILYVGDTIASTVDLSEEAEK